MNQLKYDSLYSGLVSINRSLGGVQSMPDSEYGAMIQLMETLSNRPVGESGDVFDAVSTVATMAENGELPIQGGEVPSQGFVIGNTGVKFGYSTFTTFPEGISFGNCWDYASMFDSCENLEVAPLINFPEGSTTNGMFYGCKALTIVPEYDLTNVTNVGTMFSGTGLRTYGDFIAPNATVTLSAFVNNMSLTSIGNIDIRSSLKPTAFLKNCSNLTSVGNITIKEFADVNISQFFQGCESLTSVPKINTQYISNPDNLNNIFNQCYALENIPEMDFGNVWGPVQLISSELPSVTTIGGFKNLTWGFYPGCGIDCMPNLTVDSLMNVINNLYDWESNPMEYEVDFVWQELYLGSNLSKLTDDQIAVATNKKWILS
jgi:hypothetical protein